MKLGIFDSGLGGVLMARAIRRHLPRYDLVYLGDTLHMPYGGRSADALYHYTERAMDFLLGTQDCKLVIVACNSASAAALRRLQRDYLPARYPDRRILGVIVPTLEEALDRRHRRIGLLATQRIAACGIYAEELTKLDPTIALFAQAAPLLVPLIEHGGGRWIAEPLESYLAPLMAQRIDSLILGCTHYPYLKPQIAAIVGPEVDILSQDEIVPGKLADYLHRHPEIETALSCNGALRFFATDVTEHYTAHAGALFGDPALSMEQAVAA